MLSELDDTLWHQIPSTFDHVGTSDPRFFDRYWFAIYSGDGGVAIQVTMGAYRNMNVLDAGAVMIVGGKQYNLRVSRSLNGSVETVCGPVRIRPIEPLKSFEIVIEPGEVRERGPDIVGEHIGVRRQDAVGNVETWG